MPEIDLDELERLCEECTPDKSELDLDTLLEIYERVPRLLEILRAGVEWKEAGASADITQIEIELTTEEYGRKMDVFDKIEKRFLELLENVKYTTKPAEAETEETE